MPILLDSGESNLLQDSRVEKGLEEDVGVAARGTYCPGHPPHILSTSGSEEAIISFWTGLEFSIVALYLQSDGFEPLAGFQSREGLGRRSRSSGTGDILPRSPPPHCQLQGPEKAMISFWTGVAFSKTFPLAVYLQSDGFEPPAGCQSREGLGRRSRSSGTAVSDRKGNTVKHLRGLYLQAKARIWP